MKITGTGEHCVDLDLFLILNLSNSTQMTTMRRQCCVGYRSDHLVVYFELAMLLTGGMSSGSVEDETY